MTIEQLAESVAGLSASVAALKTQNTELTGAVAVLTIEVQRGKDMIQELSESHDLNRRELQFATTRATALKEEFVNKVTVADILMRDVTALRNGK